MWMPPFPDGFIISFIKCWEISSFRDSEATVFSGADFARLRVASIASAYLANLQWLSFQFRRHPAPALAADSGDSTVAALGGMVGLVPSQAKDTGAAGACGKYPAKLLRPGTAGTVSPTVPKGLSCTHSGSSHPSKAWRAPRNLNAKSFLHGEIQTEAWIFPISTPKSGPSVNTTG